MRGEGDARARWLDARTSREGGLDGVRERARWDHGAHAAWERLEEIFCERGRSVIRGTRDARGRRARVGVDWKPYGRGNPVEATRTRAGLETDDVSRGLSTRSRSRDVGEDDREGREAPTASPED